jgi:hypothetical protein
VLLLSQYSCGKAFASLSFTTMDDPLLETMLLLGGAPVPVIGAIGTEIRHQFEGGALALPGLKKVLLFRR